MNDIPTNKVKAIRVSKSSFKSWTLYGAIDQALKTSTQADAVRPIPIAVDVHGIHHDLVMWINATEAELDGSDELNPPAQMILNREQHAKHTEALVEKIREQVMADDDEDDGPIMAMFAMKMKGPYVKGVAILTGAGGTDFPADDSDEAECILAALTGGHPG